MKKEQSFGLIFGLIFFFLGLYQLVYMKHVNFLFFGSSILLFFLAYFFPRVLILPNKAWLRLGELLGKIMTPIIMFIIFFFVITPTSFTLKIFKKSLLTRYKKAQTYWVDREESKTDMTNQF